MATYKDKKITLLAENCWVIRSSRIDPLTGQGSTKYIESHKTSVSAPVAAMIFPNIESAEKYLWAYNAVWTDRGRKNVDRNGEIFDIVNLYEEIMASPNGKSITIKKE